MDIGTLQSDLATSLKGGNAVRVETLRFLIAGIRNSVTNKYGADWETKMTQEDVAAEVKKQIKTHTESIDAFTKAGRSELVAKEEAQLAILKEFAPKELSDEELQTLLAPIAASGEKNFGLLMKSAMAAVQGKAGGDRVSKILKELAK